MSSHGGAPSTSNTQSSARKAFESFRDHHAVHAALAPRSFDELTQVTNRELWERLATYLIDDMEKQGGGNHAGGTVVDYLGALLNLSQRRLKASDPSTAQFFACLAPTLGRTTGSGSKV